MKQHLHRLEHSIETWFVLPLLVIFFFLRLPSFIEPYWYGDEGVYEIIGKAIMHGRMLYSGIWDNKPPLLYLTYALFNGDQFSTRALSLIVGLATIILFFFLSRNLFSKRSIVFITTLVFALFLATPVTEGNIANAENFMLLPIIAAGYLLYKKKTDLKSSSLKSNAYLFLIGILLSTAFLYKIVALFDFAAFAVFLICLYAPKENKLNSLLKLDWILRCIKPLFIYFLGFVLPIALTTLFFVFKGIGSDFYHSIFSSNVGYVGYGNTFVIPQGFLILKLAILATVVCFLFIKRSQLSNSVIFVLLWLSFAVFDIFFSQRNYTHYFLMIIPSLSLAFGIPTLCKNNHERLWVSGAVIIVGLVTMSYFLNTRYLHLVSYYNNYLQYITNHKSLDEYQKFFDSNTSRDYMLADYLRMHTLPGQLVFLWGNSAQVYVLSDTFPPGRYTVAYHIAGNPQATAETQKVLDNIKPKYILLFNNAADFPFHIENYHYLESLSHTQIYERIR